MNVAGRKIAGSTTTLASAGFEIVECGFDVTRDLQRIRAELFLDDEQEAWAVVDDGITDRLRKSLDDGGHITNSQRRSVSR